MAKKSSTEAAANTAPVNDGFLPQEAGWVEVSTTGAAIFKPEAAVAEGKPLKGIAYDVILAKGGTSDCKIWEAIVVRTTEPTIGFKGEGQVVVDAGEDVLIASHAILSDVARRALNPNTAQHVKLMPTEQKVHASNKKWSYWDYRIAFGPIVSRATENLFRLPERDDVLSAMAEYEAGLGGRAPDDGSKKVLASYHQRLRVLSAQGTPFIPQLAEATASA